MRHLTVLSVCLLLVLAGCNAAPGGSSQPPAETTTVSPNETTASEADFPSGLSESGVTDAAALADAHEEALAGQSYTYDREARIVLDNGTVSTWSDHVQVGADRLEFNSTQTGDGIAVAGYGIDDMRTYTNGSATFWNASVFRKGYRRAPGRGFAAGTFSSGILIERALGADETSVGSVERDGETWYLVRAEGGNRTFTSELPNRTVTVETTNHTATALVAPSGFVRNVTFEYDFERANVSGHRTMSVRYSQVGTTEVAVPAWVEDAKRATNETRTALETNGGLDG